MNIKCICGFEFNKKEFKRHFRNCERFLNKFKDFDFNISKTLAKYFKFENGSIIKFLLQRYVKLISHKIKSSEEQNNIRKAKTEDNKKQNNSNVSNNNIKNFVNPFFEIQKDKIENKNNINNDILNPIFGIQQKFIEKINNKNNIFKLINYTDDSFNFNNLNNRTINNMTDNDNNKMNPNNLIYTFNSPMNNVNKINSSNTLYFQNNNINFSKNNISKSSNKSDYNFKNFKISYAFMEDNISNNKKRLNNNLNSNNQLKQNISNYSNDLELIKSKSDRDIYNKFEHFEKSKEVNFKIIPTMKYYQKTDFHNISFNKMGAFDFFSTKTIITFEGLKYKLISIGSEFKKFEIETIINYCKEIYLRNKGNVNYEFVKYLSNCLKALFLNEWAIIITNRENKDIFYNLTSEIKNRTILFYLDNKRFYIMNY